MRHTSIISTAQELELKLNVPDHVFKPSFMTAELLKSFSQVRNLRHGWKILDLGTGSGIIALTLHMVGYKNIYVSDKYTETVEAARANFTNYSFEPKQVFVSDMFDSINEKFDLIITNPPAFPTAPDLKKNRGLDGAVYSGLDGRDFMRSFISNVSKHLTPRGCFLMTAPSFLDWSKLDALLEQNSIDYTEIISGKCTLPTYGYPSKKFIENFQTKFSPAYYEDANLSGKHHWMNLENKVEYKVKTICGKPKSVDV